MNRIMPFRLKKAVCIAPMYVCGNLHHIMFEVLELGENGQWNNGGRYYWYDTVSEAVVWAILEGRPIDNWAECVAWLGMEADARRL